MQNKTNKVAYVSLAFWIMKILATTLGETTGDLLSMTLKLGYAVSLIITLSFFLIMLIAQLKSNKFRPVLYWLVIVGTTTVGTEISDFMDRTLGFGYLLGSSVLFISLLFVLAVWYYRYKNLSIYPIINSKIELLYWVAILFSNSLGTAFGDFLSDNIGLSYMQGAMVTSGVIIIVVALHYLTKLNQILLFWIAFIFTRPFGATFGDFLTKPIAKGGMEFGTLSASGITLLLLIVVLLITYRKQYFSNNKSFN
jgi:uncharacterized membrane-anchored protein